MNRDRLHHDTGPEVLYNAHTTLSQVMKKVDDLVVQAYKISTDTKPVGFDLIRFSEFLSAVASAVQDWVPILEKATQKSQAIVANKKLPMKDRRSTPYCKIRIPVDTDSDKEDEDLKTERQETKKILKLSPLSNPGVINLLKENTEEITCDDDDSVEDVPAKTIERTLSDSPLVAGSEKFQFFTMTPIAKKQQNAMYSEPSQKYPHRYTDVLRPPATAMPSTRHSVGQILPEASSSTSSCLDVVLHSFESPGMISSASSSPEETVVRNFTTLFKDESDVSASDTGNEIPEPCTRHSGGDRRVTITSSIVSEIESKSDNQQTTPDCKKGQDRLQNVHDEDLSNKSTVFSSLSESKNQEGVSECLSGSSLNTPSIHSDALISSATHDEDLSNKSTVFSSLSESGSLLNTPSVHSGYVSDLSSSFKTPTFQAVDVVENATMSPLSPSSFKTPTAESVEIIDNMSISTALPFRTPSFQNDEDTEDVSLSTHLTTKNLVKSLTSSFGDGVSNVELSPTLLITPPSSKHRTTIKLESKSDSKSSIREEEATCDLPLENQEFNFLNVQEPIILSPQSFSVCRTTSAELSPTLLLTPALIKQCRAPFSILKHEENEPIFELSPAKSSLSRIASEMKASFVMSLPLCEYTTQQEPNGQNPEFSFICTPCPTTRPASKLVNPHDSSTPLPPQSLVKRYSNLFYSESGQDCTSVHGISEENQKSCDKVNKYSFSSSSPAQNFSKSSIVVEKNLASSVITPSTSKSCGYSDIICNSTPMPHQSVVKRYSNFFEEPKDLYSPSTIKSAKTEISLSSPLSPSQSSTSNSPDVLSHSMEMATPMPPQSLIKRYSRFLDMEEDEDDVPKSATLTTPMLATSPPKTCALMRPSLDTIQEKEKLGISSLQLPNLDYKTPLRTQAIVPDKASNESASNEEDMDFTNLNKPSRNHSSEESVKITPSSDMQFSTVRKTHHSIKRTPLVDLQLSTVRKPGAPLPGEQTLKRELWTRMEAEFTTMENVCKSLFTENLLDVEQTDNKTYNPAVENKQQCLKGHQKGRQLVIPKGLQKRGFQLHN